MNCGLACLSCCLGKSAFEEKFLRVLIFLREIELLAIRRSACFKGMKLERVIKYEDLLYDRHPVL